MKKTISETLISHSGWWSSIMCRVELLFICFLGASATADLSNSITKLTRQASDVKTTRVNLITKSYIWIIENYKLFTAANTVVYSPRFQIKEEGLDVKFATYIQINSNTIAAGFYHVPESKEVKVNWYGTIELLHASTGESIYNKTFAVALTPRSEYLYTLNFINVEKFLKMFSNSTESNLFIKLTVHIASNILQENKPASSPETMQSLLFSDFGKKLLNNNTFCDLNILVKQKIFCVHKVVLLTRAHDLFSKLIANFTATKDGLTFVSLNGINEDAFSLLIEYLYTDRFPLLLLSKEIKQLFVASTNFKIPGLEVLCFNYVARDVRVDNLVEWFTFAQENNLQMLENYLVEFLKLNGATVETKIWNTFLQRYSGMKCKTN